MELLTADQWIALFAGARISARHLEMRDAYAVGDEAESLRRFLQDGHFDEEAERTGRAWWLELMRAATSRGVGVQRARVISEPVSGYIAFEHAGTGLNVAAGEQVKWLPRRLASTITLPGNDFWIFDGERVVFNLFDGVGDWAGNEMTLDPAVAKLCATSFEAVWAAAIDHSEYVPPRV